MKRKTIKQIAVAWWLGKLSVKERKLLGLGMRNLIAIAELKRPCAAKSSATRDMAELAGYIEGSQYARCA